MKTVQGLLDEGMQERIAAGMNQAHPKYGVLFRLGLFTGLRISDILGLKVKTVLTGSFTVTEIKTKKLRHIELDTDTLNALRTFIKGSNLRPNDFLIYSTENNRRKSLSRIQAYKTTNRIGRELFPDISIGTHTMRKTFAINLFRRTGSLSVVQEALNHRYPSTTMRYLGTFEDMAKTSLGIKPAPMGVPEPMPELVPATPATPVPSAPSAPSAPEVPLAPAKHIELSSPKEIRESLSVIANLVFNSKLTAPQGNCLISACNAILSSLRTDEKTYSGQGSPVIIVNDL